MPKQPIKNSRNTALVRPSSSLIILSPANDTRDGYNYRVVMVRRNDKSSFKNATVFPGGNVDEADHAAEDPKRVAEDGQIVPTLDAFRRCAVRETFEETGILLTTPPVTFESGERKRWRAKVHDSGTQFGKLLDHFGTSLDLDALIHYANWITPAGLPRRYNTMFFLTTVQSKDTLPARHDAAETLEVMHFTPQEAIRASHKGEILLFPPQMYMLSDLALVKDYSELLSVMRDRPVVTVQPQMKKELAAIVLPGDEARGGPEGARNRVEVTVSDGAMKPSVVMRKGVPQFADIVPDMSMKEKL